MQQQHYPFEILLQQEQHGLVKKDSGIFVEETCFQMADLMLGVASPQLLSSSTVSSGSSTSPIMEEEAPVVVVKKNRPRRPPLSEVVVDADNEGKIKEIRIAGAVYLEEDPSVVSDVSDEDEDDEEDGYEYDDEDVSTLSSQGTVPLSISVEFQL
jgi:hypothetical protein